MDGLDPGSYSYVITVSSPDGQTSSYEILYNIAGEVPKKGHAFTCIYVPYHLVTSVFTRCSSLPKKIATSLKSD